MTRIVKIVAVALCLSLTTALAAFAQGLNTIGSRNGLIRKDSVRRSSDSDKKFEIKAGMVKRFWLEDISPDVNLNKTLGSEYQVALSGFTGKGEVEFVFSGGKSKANFGYSQDLRDRNNLILWLGDLYLGDVPVKLNYTEQVKLWNFQLHYWHTLEADEKSLISFGPGLHLNVLEKTTKMKVQYTGILSGATILNPHYQDSQSQTTSLIPGLSMGARWKLGIGAEQQLGTLVLSLESVFAKPASELRIGNQPVKNMNSLNASVGYGYAFE